MLLNISDRKGKSMNYYKILKDGMVIDVNYVFLRWQEKHRILIGCEAADAQYIQSSDGMEVYRVRWLNPVNSDAPVFPVVEAEEISEEEYLELRKQLDEGLTPVEPEPEPPAEPELEEPELPAETVMTVGEMRREILRLREENEFLSGCLLEMSEVVYA